MVGDRAKSRSLRPLDDLLGSLVGGTRPLPPRRVPLALAKGAFAGAPVVVAADLPPVALARIDGWAVEAVETVGASPYGPVFVPPRPVRLGEPLPPGCDAVIPVGSAEASGGMLLIEAPVDPRADTTPRGSEARAGNILRPSRFGSALLALLEATGTPTVEIRRPVVAIIADDASGSPLADTCFGWMVEALGDGAIERGASGADADLTIVVGRGDPDPSTASKEDLARGLALTGAEDTSVALSVNGTPLIRVPPRLDAVFLAARLLALPVIERLLDLSPPPSDPEAAKRWALARPLTRKIASRVGFAEVTLLRGTADGAWEPVATDRLTATALALAEAYVVIPAGDEGLPAGAVVEGLLLQPRQPGWWTS